MADGGVNTDEMLRRREKDFLDFLAKLSSNRAIRFLPLRRNSIGINSRDRNVRLTANHCD